jgi:hypothetical protein
MTRDPRYYAPVAPGQPVSGIQDVLGRLDTVISRFEHRHEGRWATEIFEDILFSGSEILGQVIFNARNCGFKARSVIAYNSSGHDLALSGGIIIGAGATEFAARVKPPRDIFRMTVFKAGTAAGACQVYLTEELLGPTVGTL